ncbi:DUF736 domain-containing protein [Aminobacter sp. SR38]|uniref:DUF736 domain-containing protein n=1 Tax=Aminobacter sp. SR38 TaxID=2774562 RepID=UPI00352CC298
MSIAPGLNTVIEAAIGAARTTGKERDHGSHRRIHHQRQQLDRRHGAHAHRQHEGPPEPDRARLTRRPDFRITAGNGVEVGAGWKAVSNDGEEYISVKLDDPSFNAPITAALWPGEKDGEYALIWNRPKREA